MHQSTLLVIFAVIAAVTCDLQTSLRMNKVARKKALCPHPSLINRRMKSRTTRANKHLGSCEVIGDTADRTDTCKFKMSCCENMYGDMLCVRARKFRNRPVEPSQPSPPPPPFKEVIPMFQDAVDVCPTACVPDSDHLADAMQYGRCEEGDTCPPGRTCCVDECTPPPESGPRQKLCYLNDPNTIPPPPPFNPTELQDFTSDLSNDGVTIFRSCPAPGEVTLCDDEVKYNFTNPVCTTGNDTECSEDGSSICCFDPCPKNIDTFRCYENSMFNMTAEGEKTAGDNSDLLPPVEPAQLDMALNPPPPPPVGAAFLPVGASMLDDAVDLPAKSANDIKFNPELVCPEGDLSPFAPCLGWAGETCREEKVCQNGKMCCSLSAPHCGDEFSYCVDGVHHDKEKGCPVPKYSSQMTAEWTESCPDGCPKGLICCQVNSQHYTNKGEPLPSHGCVEPEKTSKN